MSDALEIHHTEIWGETEHTESCKFLTV